MSEGLLHVQERNRQWDAGNPTAAWFENRILEKYFAPVLDTPSYVSRTGHRWPAAQRADARARGRRGIRARSEPRAGGVPDLHVAEARFSAISAVVVCALAAGCGRDGAAPARE